MRCNSSKSSAVLLREEEKVLCMFQRRIPQDLKEAASVMLIVIFKEENQIMSRMAALRAWQDHQQAPYAAAMMVQVPWSLAGRKMLLCKQGKLAS